MPLVVLRPVPPPRFARPRETPRPAPVVALRGPQERHRLIAPPVVQAPPRPTGRRAPPPAPLALPPPVLRLVQPPPEKPPRLSLRAPVPVPTPTEAPPAVVTLASSVGITGGAGTRVVMVPADLTQPGRVDVTQFRIALFAGVW